MLQVAAPASYCLPASPHPGDVSHPCPMAWPVACFSLAETVQTGFGPFKKTVRKEVPCLPGRNGDFVVRIAKLFLPTFSRQIALYSPGCRLSSSRFVTINSTSIKPSIKVRNLTYYILGKVYDVDSLLAQVNNDKDTHKDKYKHKEKRKLPRRKGSCIKA